MLGRVSDLSFQVLKFCSVCCTCPEICSMFWTTPSSFRSTQGQLDLGMCSKHRHSVVLCHVKIDSGTDLHTFGRRPAFCAFWPCKAPEGPAKDPCQSNTFARPQSAVSEHFSSCRHQCYWTLANNAEGISSHLPCLQAFSAWIHICAIRLFTESILRYGLPPKFLSAIMKPNAKFAQKLRKALAGLFSASGNFPCPSLSCCVC